MDGVLSGLAAIMRCGDGLAEMHARIGHRFARSEAREWAGRSLAGLLDRLERTNGWQLAEAMDEAGPRGVQRLLSEAAWDPDGRRSFLLYGPEGTGVDELVRVCTARWRIEDCLAEAKGDVGLDHDEVRRWNAWHRHATLCLLAHAYLVVTRQAACREEASKKGAPTPA